MEELAPEMLHRTPSALIDLADAIGVPVWIRAEARVCAVVWERDLAQANEEMAAMRTALFLAESDGRRLAAWRRFWEADKIWMAYVLRDSEWPPEVYAEYEAARAALRELGEIP